MAEGSRVLLVDDHAVVRDGLRALLEGSGLALDVVAEAATGEDAVRAAAEQEPALILMDISLPGMDGLQATREITARRPDAQVIVLSMFDEPRRVDQALRAGARAYVLKGDGIGTLLDAISAVRRGESYLSPGVTEGVVQGYLGKRRRANDQLTPREREVLALIAKGFTGQEIAELLGLGPKTVGNHRSHVMEKLDLHRTASLVRYALENGIGL